MNLKSRLKELAAKSEKRPTWEEAKRNARAGVGRLALISGGVLAGGLAGLRTLPRLLPKGRLVQEGESLLGKVVYNNQGLTTPAEIIHLPNGRSLRGVLRKNREAAGLKGTLSRAALKADEFLGVPQRHYGVGVGSGRIAEVSKSRGRKIVDQGEFGKKVYIDNDGKILRERGIPQRAEGRAGTMNDAEVEAFNKRYEASQADKRWDRKSVCPAGANNCESYARGIGTGKAVSRQVQAMRVGAMAGAVAGGGGATWLTQRKEK
jgi:hypothetical protein